ncbi:exostosin [Trypanosoma grayi]|uniref:exostosin n=1 Tax=Trypanosoma grayi TaxID=71804 RepID=UPI0004F4722A|nr:exostosin [Trypanosoma grayi]KEG10386.1 exostosin [Trypanosoma grayi]
MLECRHAVRRRRTLVAVLLAVHIGAAVFLMHTSTDDAVPQPVLQGEGQEGLVGGTGRGMQLLEGRRRSSDPLVTGDGFRSACHLVFDDTLSLRAQKEFLAEILRAVREKQDAPSPPSAVVVSVFVQTHFMDKFIECCLRRVPRADSEWQLLLVSHNSDVSAPFNKRNLYNKKDDHSYTYQLEWVLDNPRVRAWYSTNTAVEHPKLWPIPIGIENFYNAYGRHVDVYREALQRVQQDKNQKLTEGKKLLFVAFGLSSYYKYRVEVLRHVKKAFAADASNVTFVHRPSKQKVVTASDVRDYMNTLREHRFVLAPRGNGMDTHRLWEALYMGSVPIVQRSTMDTRLLSNLPVLLVDSFADVTPSLLMSPQALALTASEHFTGVASRLLSMGYWRRVITAGGKMQ